MLDFSLNCICQSLPKLLVTISFLRALRHCDPTIQNRHDQVIRARLAPGERQRGRRSVPGDDSIIRSIHQACHCQAYLILDPATVVSWISISFSGLKMSYDNLSHTPWDPRWRLMAARYSTRPSTESIPGVGWTGICLMQVIIRYDIRYPYACTSRPIDLLRKVVPNFTLTY